MIIEKAKSGGIILPRYDIGFDCRSAPVQHMFISHAHSDHTPRRRNQPVYCTTNTLRLMQKRGHRNDAQLLDFYTPINLPNVQVTLFPAGHILGSSMIYVETDEGSMLYTGDYRTLPSPVTEGFEYPGQVDILITEATFGLPIYKWLPSKKLGQKIQEFALNTLNAGNVPAFLAYDLGKSQELLYLLADTGLPVQVSPRCYELSEIYEKAGFKLGYYELHNIQSSKDNVVIAPISSLRNGFISEIGNKRAAYCSGWAVHETNRRPQNVDTLIPLSDHLDFFELIDFCKTLNPQKVFITHTPDASVVQHYLNELNIHSAVL